MLSMGFGFVEYTTKEQAKQAQKAFQGVQVDGHALQIKVSDRTSAKGPDGESSAVAGEVAGSMALRSSNKAKGTKLVVKNVAFEATKADLRDLFSSFGQIKSIRLPKKFSGGHRGFAFVEFLTPQVALQVKEQMKDTHLYGRHLVIDWEEDHNATLDDLRAKVSKQYRREEFNQQASASKRIKLNGGDDED
ncbi:Multiple RNA-binding domain-containing protein 1 [Spiromyces aspiralis]|uniref:Multiple RNA-binding domain-containing protein 1 n=1 Tax=Spiromyces aspiralis TaxID=68401 RepID=A0ACC1HDX5_9FUNG|nr:Multiple RNA-binding domain-containing protein 1 [Spiromyces aspiralis]